MKKTSMFLTILLSFIILFSSCSEDDSGDTNKLKCTWTSTILEPDDATFEAKIVFSEDMTFLWEPITANSGHEASTGKYRIDDGDVVVLFDDPDCTGIDGSYDFTISGDKLTIFLIQDDCEMRAPMVAVTWTKATVYF